MPLSDYEQHVFGEIERMLMPTAVRIDKVAAKHQRRTRWGRPIRTGALVAGFGLMSVGLVLINALGETITAIGFTLLVVALCAMVYRSRLRRLLAGDDERWPPPRDVEWGLPGRVARYTAPLT